MRTSQLSRIAMIALGLMLSACQPAIIETPTPIPEPTETPTPTPIPPILETCPLPCWAGIIPGEITRDEAVDVLENGRDLPSDVDVLDDTNDFSWHSSPDDEIRGGRILYTDVSWIVSQITLDFRDPRTVGEIIEWLGTPTRVSVDSSCRDFGFGLLFPLHGVEAMGIENDGYFDALDAEDNVYSLVLFSPELMGHRLIEPLRDYLRDMDWQGYTDYCQRIGK